MNRISLPELKNARISKDWTQDMLAEFSGLSVRTIQRIESGGTATLESAKSLCAALELDNYRSLMTKPDDNTDQDEPPKHSGTACHDTDSPPHQTAINERDAETLTMFASALRLNVNFILCLVGLGIVLAAFSHPKEALKLVIQAIPYVATVGLTFLLLLSNNPRSRAVGSLLGLASMIWLMWIALNFMGGQFDDMRKKAFLLSFTSSMSELSLVVSEVRHNNPDFDSATMRDVLSDHPEYQEKFADFVCRSKAEPLLAKCVKGLALDMSVREFGDFYLEHDDRCIDEL